MPVSRLGLFVYTGGKGGQDAPPIQTELLCMRLSLLHPKKYQPTNPIPITSQSGRRLLCRLFGLRARGAPCPGGRRPGHHAASEQKRYRAAHRAGGVEGEGGMRRKNRERMYVCY